MNQKINIKTGIQLARRGIQILSFFLFPGLFTSSFYAIKAIITTVMAGNASLSTLSPSLWLLAATVPVTLLFGRFFCGFMCSFGAMSDFIWFLSKKTRKTPFKISETVDGYLKYLKYVILVVIVVGIWILNLVSLDSLSSPFTIFGMYANIGTIPSLTYLFSVGGFLLLLIIIASFFVERFFCRYLCPMGAVYAILSKTRIFHIKKKRDNCGNCRACSKKCSMGIPLYQVDRMTSAECINCFECATVCPRDNVKANPTPYVASAMSVVAVTGLFYVGTIASASSTPQAETNQTVLANQGTGNYVDGTYTGSAFGFRGDTEVSITVESGFISDIEILSYQDDAPYFERAQDTVISEIIENQDTNVDAVSGATFSSNGIMEAVANALGTQSSATQESATQESEVQESAASTQTATGSYQDGTYTGTGTGFRGNTEVSVTVSGGQITDITVVSYEDDAPYFERAQDTVISDIIESQDVNVDAVSGATFSSNGIMEAVANAIGVSYENVNSTMERGHGGHGGHGGFGNH